MGGPASPVYPPPPPDHGPLMAPSPLPPSGAPGEAPGWSNTVSPAPGRGGGGGGSVWAWPRVVRLQEAVTLCVVPQRNRNFSILSTVPVPPEKASLCRRQREKDTEFCPRK